MSGKGVFARMLFSPGVRVGKTIAQFMYHDQFKSWIGTVWLPTGRVMKPFTCQPGFPTQVSGIKLLQVGWRSDINVAYSEISCPSAGSVQPGLFET